MLNTLSSVSVWESRIQHLCDPQWFKDTASREPTTIVAPESQSRTCPSDHGKSVFQHRAIDPIAMRTSWRSNSDITGVTSIGYPRMSASGESSTTMHRLLHASGSHPIPPPNDPKTNQYNQDLGLIHSKNGNHLESPNEGSSIDHQVTIYLHAQNFTMFPTNETCSELRYRCELVLQIWIEHGYYILLAVLCCLSVGTRLLFWRPSGYNLLKPSSNHKKAHPKRWKLTAQLNARLSSFEFSSQLKTASKIGRKGKVFSRGFQLYQELEKRRSESTGNGDRK
ncbi:hypothetical protein F511_26450 [Dorcoceras hygrometricum]|uniref:Uncharacterized protein n=1 Tax=Dorcoceras hygrometricum TaxID=472368 RepID=A0A2Z7CTJ4_9LAMI|nr:hypothetical protein F511_26450 [Dorcoceras hygrometricum]